MFPLTSLLFYSTPLLTYPTSTPPTTTMSKDDEYDYLFKGMLQTHSSKKRRTQFYLHLFFADRLREGLTSHLFHFSRKKKGLKR
jgi:hypothetical protein